MFDYTFTFVRPNYLWLLLGLPLLWYFSYRSLASLGRMRAVSALALRTLVLLLFVMAIAEIQMVKTTDRLTVIYMLDNSLSIPEVDRKLMVEYVNRSILEHRKKNDRVGVIVFGKNAGIEIPPFDDDVQLITPLESLIDPEYTDLSSAMKLAMGSFPEDAAKRVVILSDGNQNRGQVLEQAKMAADSSIGIDVVPVEYRYRNEVLVERLSLPSELRKGQPSRLRAVVNNTALHPVEGRLVISQTTDGQPVVVAEQDNVVLEPNKKTVFEIPLEIEQPNFYTFDARFIPKNPADDTMVKNNRATAFTVVAGAARILLIEDDEFPNEHKQFIEALRNQDLEVTVRDANNLFTGLGELQPYDAVVLANVPRDKFSDEQIEMLVKNTQDLGAGLMMLGGPNSFGAGGWSNTKVEEAMPVDFHIKSAKIVPKGALALLMHASEMANGNHWQKVTAKAAIQALGSQDLCGLIHWDFNGERWLWNHPIGMTSVGPNRQRMLGQVDRMAPGDMPDFDPSMVMAQKALAKTDAQVRHMIIISDGDPSPPTNATLRALANSKITVTAIAIGTHGQPERGVMKRIASVTGGKYYEVNNPNALPQIYTKEARKVARPLIHENKNGFAANIKHQTEIISGIQALPKFTGYVMTTLKESPLVEISLVAPEPGPEEANNTLLASWQYGLGRTVAFTSDAGERWWDGNANYEKLFSQMVRWVMRPTGQTGKFFVNTQVQDGQTRIMVTALDESDEFKNYLNMSGQVVTPGPDLKSLPVTFEQKAPGTYEAVIDSDEAGSYFLMIHPGVDADGKAFAPLRTGINIAYSAEFREREANRSLMIDLASDEPLKGKPGQVVESSGTFEELVKKFNPFRHDLPKATSNQDVWHWLVIAAGLIFFTDVFNRRVTVSLAWVPPLASRVWSQLRGQEPPPPPTEYMQRLRSKKAEATSQFEQQKASLRFEVKPETVIDPNAVQDASAPTGPTETPKPSLPKSGGLAAEKQEESYTDRLLKAKKKVWDDRKDEGKK